MTWAKFYLWGISEVGINRDDFWLHTFAEVGAISRAQSRREDKELKRSWEQTASILALLVNINRAKGKQPVQPSHFMPRFEGDEADTTEVGIEYAFEIMKKLEGKHVS